MIAKLYEQYIYRKYLTVSRYYLRTNRAESCEQFDVKAVPHAVRASVSDCVVVTPTPSFSLGGLPQHGIDPGVRNLSKGEL